MAKLPLNESSPTMFGSRIKDRRETRRLQVKHQYSLSVIIRCGPGTICQGYLVNLSAKGMLVEFPKGQLPPVPTCSPVSVKLQYLGDSIWLPGEVRHRMGNKVGFHFPSLAGVRTTKAKHPLSVVVQALSRASSTPS